VTRHGAPSALDHLMEALEIAWNHECSSSSSSSRTEHAGQQPVGRNTTPTHVDLRDKPACLTDFLLTTIQLGCPRKAFVPVLRRLPRWTWRKTARRLLALHTEQNDTRLVLISMGKMTTAWELWKRKGDGREQRKMEGWHQRSGSPGSHLDGSLGRTTWTVA
jgi:hypothetical protein